MRDYLFIYGSLITGTPHAQINRCIRCDCVVLGRASVKGRLYDLGSYPGAVADKEQLIVGQLLKIRNVTATLRLLDGYEAFDLQQPRRSEFVRAATTATLTESNRKYRCWVYWYNLKVSPHTWIEGGDYVTHRNMQTKQRTK